MKPLVSALNAWTCIVVSIFAIVILSVVGGLFKGKSHIVLGTIEEPEDGAAVAGTIYGAVVVYGIFLVFCGSQALMHIRASRKGAISLQ